MKRSHLTFCLLLAPVVSCGASSSAANVAKEPETTPSPASSAEADPASSAAANTDPTPSATDLATVPTKCADGQAEGVCAPPKAFVRALCGAYPKPDIALILFSKSSPFTRVYLNRNMEAWYTSGQQSISAKLVFDEEVVVLAHPKGSTGGMVIGNGGTNYDVLRIDGVCSSVEPEAISLKRPPAPKYANIPWQHLEQNVREALLDDSSIAKADASRRKECKGTTGLGMLTPGCARADDKLSTTIAEYITRGGQSPMPKYAR
ncbi:MAG TPA: hypothetical protein VJT73_19720 [Polyangiaceae bacterium]|nr:hypothetical protein [Polyangiaceae bacterium]